MDKVTKLFSAQFSEWNVRVKADTEAAQKILSVNTDTEIVKRVTSILEKLNGLETMALQKYSAAYLAYSNYPCENYKQFNEDVSMINKSYDLLLELQRNLVATPAGSKSETSVTVTTPGGYRVCIRCGAESPDDSLYCVKCGAALEQVQLHYTKTKETALCAKCGKSVQMEAKYCQYCGNSVSKSEEPVSEVLYSSFYPWKNSGIGKSPLRAELPLGFSEIRKALLSFRVEMHSSMGIEMDPEQAILINDKPVSGLDLPFRENSKALQFMERKDVDVTSLLRTSPRGEKNVIQVNYILSAPARMSTNLPKSTIGTLTMEIKVSYPGLKEIIVKSPNFKFCMWDGKPIPRDAKVCPYCQRGPPLAGQTPMRCINCPALLPSGAEYCEECGAKQVGEEIRVATSSSHLSGAEKTLETIEAQLQAGSNGSQ